MPSEKKALPLRISPELWCEIKAWAEQDMRSVNAQIELILRDAVAQRRRTGQSRVEGERLTG